MLRIPSPLRTARTLRALGPALLLTILAACNGDKVTGDPSDGIDAAKVKTGTLTVLTAGLPAGATPALDVVGAKTSFHATSGVPLTLDAADYTINASALVVGGLTYEPAPASQQVTVQFNKSVTANVTYALRTGTLSVAVSGLPTGNSAAITLTSPTGANIPVTSSMQIAAAVPGAWHLSALPVSIGGFTYSPTPTTADNSLASGGTVDFAVQYTLTTGALGVVVSGLPAGINGAVTVAGPNGFSRAVTTTTTLTDLTPGQYTVSSSDVVASGITYRPAASSQQVAVSASTVAAPVQVTYAPLVGTLAIGVISAPAGASNMVQVTGPNGFSRTISGTTVLADLPVGTYNVIASDIANAIGVWKPAPGTAQRTVTTGGRDSVGVTYSIATGSLAIAVSGVPAGVGAAISVTGPNGFAQNVATTQTLVSLAPGTYTIAAAALTNSGTTYNPTPATQQVVVGASEIAAGAAVTYSAVVTNGQLNLTISGLPAGANGAVTLTGPGTNSAINASTSVSLLAGTYTVTASSVVNGGTTYDASPASQNVIITAGGTSNATVSYTAAPPLGASDDLLIDFAYLTQATQRPDNSVTLVAGRSALLRVFVNNNRANSLAPSVRVRVYNGATLIQTTTISAPGGSVPLASNEGSLTSSWNTVIPAANVTTNMRVLVDVDPTNAIAESDEANNQWPRSGTPQTVSVLSVPTFNIRFVPVTTGALTGDVTDANKDNFLKTARLIWPINTVNADVRLPFTSSATSLLSDGTGWLTVLSEMNSLRAADGAASTYHYYGVVKVSYNSGVAGYGYVPGRAAMGWDYMQSGDGVAAHEWGHNFNRPHAPCGGVAGPESSFPYSGGLIGMYGWNSTSGALIQPTASDIMGYCSNQWVSDWAWTKSITYRQSSGAEVAAATGSVAGGTTGGGDGLLVWGRISNGQVLLEPAFRVNAAPTVASTHGTHRVEALDRNGRIIAELPLEAQKVDHVENADERQFAVVLPWSARLERSLATLRVRDARTPLMGTSRTSAAAAAVATDDSLPQLASPAEAIEAAGGDRVRVRWNRAQYPMVMARDAATGQVVAFIRQSGADFVAKNGRAIDLVFSDGVRSVTKRHQR